MPDGTSMNVLEMLRIWITSLESKGRLQVKYAGWYQQILFRRQRHLSAVREHSEYNTSNDTAIQTPKLPADELDDFSQWWSTASSSPCFMILALRLLRYLVNT